MFFDISLNFSNDSLTVKAVIAWAQSTKALNLDFDCIGCQPKFSGGWDACKGFLLATMKQIICKSDFLYATKVNSLHSIWQITINLTSVHSLNSQFYKLFTLIYLFWSLNFTLSQFSLLGLRPILTWPVGPKGGAKTARDCTPFRSLSFCYRHRAMVRAGAWSLKNSAHRKSISL